MGRFLALQPSPEDHAHRRPEAGRLVAHTKAQASVDPERVAELMKESTKDVDAWWRIGLRRILGKDLGVEARLLLQVVAQRNRLLTAVAASS